MKLTKEDYMRLPKERLAELLVERDNEPTITPVAPTIIPSTIPDPWNPYRYPYGSIVTWANTTKI